VGDAKMTSPSGSFTTYTAAAAYSEATKAAAAAVAEVAKERDEARRDADHAKSVLRVCERDLRTRIDDARQRAKQSEARVAELEALLATVREHLHFSEPEFCDGRLSWVPVQMERQDYSALRVVQPLITAALAPQEKKEVPRG